MATTFSLAKYHRCVDTACTIQANGKVTNVVGLVIEAQGPVSRLGTVCDIYTKSDSRKITAEVLGFKDNKVLMMPLQEIRGIGPGCPIVARQHRAVIPVGPGLLGRVIDGLGNPIDNKGPIPAKSEYPIYGTPVNPLTRKRISKPLDLGIRAINGLLSVGCGQRMGIFAGSGVGKSVYAGCRQRAEKS